MIITNCCNKDKQRWIELHVDDNVNTIYIYIYMYIYIYC